MQRWLSEFHDDELKQIPLMPPGSRLEANATYLNLADGASGEFTAEGKEDIGDADYIAPKAEVDYELWNRLRGVDNPERTGGRPRPR